MNPSANIEAHDGYVFVDGEAWHPNQVTLAILQLTSANAEAIKQRKVLGLFRAMQDLPAHSHDRYQRPDPRGDLQ